MCLLNRGYINNKIATAINNDEGEWEGAPHHANDTIAYRIKTTYFRFMPFHSTSTAIFSIRFVCVVIFLLSFFHLFFRCCCCCKEQWIIVSSIRSHVEQQKHTVFGLILMTDWSVSKYYNGIISTEEAKKTENPDHYYYRHYEFSMRSWR